MSPIPARRSKKTRPTFPECQRIRKHVSYTISDEAQTALAALSVKLGEMKSHIVEDLILNKLKEVAANEKATHRSTRSDF